MDGAVIFGAITGSIGTVLSLYLLYEKIASECSCISPYITDWVTVTEAEGYLLIKVRAVMQNKSRIANTVERIVIKARDEKDFCFEPSKLKLLNDGKAWVDYLDGHIEEICRSADILPMPTNIEGKQSVSGWLGFAISPEYVEKAKKQRWCLKVFDQSGKNYLSTRERDQIAPWEKNRETVQSLGLELALSNASDWISSEVNQMSLPDFNIAKFNIPISITKAFEKGKIAESYEQMYKIAQKLAGSESKLFQAQKMVEFQSDLMKIPRGRLGTGSIQKPSVDNTTKEILEYQNQRLDHHMSIMIHMLEIYATSRPSK
jgi:hypothetical protein